MTQRFCCFINYSENEDCCGKPACCKHGFAWLCAAHYDIVIDYVAGRGTGDIVFGYDLSLNQEPVVSIAYK
jgi:hypothetical protein